MEVKIKKLHKDGVIPTYSRDGDCGLDLTAISREIDACGNVVYGTGISVEIPSGFYADLCPRSSISKYDLVLANSIGKIDSNYRGELIFKFKQTHDLYRCSDNDARFYDKNKKIYEIGDRIGQIIIMPYPKVEFIEVDELSSTERGAGGFGSSGV